jgi:glycosyltransferase involved in cell wall biosynthesis
MPRVTVLDMQPIDPPLGGGRLRLLGLYHGLGADMPTVYVGTYDWPGERLREQALSATLTERMIPLCDAHFTAAHQLSNQVDGKTVIDSAFASQAHLSPEYLDAARAAAREADIVVYSHPWLYPLTKDVLDRSRQIVVYDAHNVEGKLRMALLDDGATGTRIVRDVVAVEADLCRVADLVLCCSSQDADDFHRLYGTPWDAMRIVPNGSFTQRGRGVDTTGKEKSRKNCGLSDEFVALFLGSGYQPNIEAAQFMIETLAPALPEMLFVIAGGVGEALKISRLPHNVRITGALSEADKVAWLSAADIAINPMFSGSGTNIKMFDFMAAGLPTVSTPTGARGIDSSEAAFAVVTSERFAATLQSYAAAGDARKALGEAGKRLVDRQYSWERISTTLGLVLRNRFARHRTRPKVSVVVPTYERHQYLSKLMLQLEAQSFRNFEVIVVDQSDQPWPDRGKDFGFDLVYVHSDVKGAVTARNTGAAIAMGVIIAFTDDDCAPSLDWLASAVRDFDEPGVIGIEGLIVSDRLDDPDWRPVTNQRFKGIGFMTANLFIASKVFHAIGGFDRAFENPHFREDTDLGWRAQALGRIRFSKDAWVYHPPHPRSLDRESLAMRSSFFTNDARLLRKHPDRYVELFVAEKQWLSNPHFWTHFLDGVRRENVKLPEPILEVLRREGPIEADAIALWGFLNSEIGLGTMGRRYAEALATVAPNFRRHSIPLLGRNNIEFISDPFEIRAGTNLIAINAHELLAGNKYFPNNIMGETYRIGYWAWELSKPPESWKPAFALVDEVWSCSSFTADSFRQATTKPVHVLHHIIEDWSHNDRADARNRLGIHGTAEFIFLSIFDFSSSCARKNPLGVIEAFNEAFGIGGSGPRLILKSHSSKGFPEEEARICAACEKNDRILRIDRVLSPDEMQLLHDACDCLVSLHRSEGFGLNIADAMIAGHPVICTGYSGNMDFTRPDNALLVDFDLVDLKEGEYPSATGQVWAEPRRSVAVSHMRQVVENEVWAQEIGRRARNTMLTEFDSASITARMMALLADKG